MDDRYLESIALGLPGISADDMKTFHVGIPMDDVEAVKKLRKERNALLTQSDKYVTKDYPHRLELDIQNWVDYRKALRDLPITARPTRDEDGNLVGVEWPTPPKTLVPDIYVLEGDLRTIQTQLNTHTHPLEPHTHPLEEHTHPLEEHTHPLEPHTHPLEEHTHPEIAIEKAKTHELQQRLTLIEHSHAALVARLEALENI